MEQTLGKRIMANRKRLGMTQDQLAEQLGVTAQAVSKWENDQSCPDIGTLPRLAEIFGISVDALLGVEPVHEAQVVQPSEEESEQPGNGVHIDNGTWEFSYDSGRKGALGFACWVLLVGCLLLAGNLLQWDVGFWSLAWPSFILCLGVFGGKRFSFFRLGCVLFGGYFLLDNLNVLPIQLGSELIWPALIVLFGLGLLADALRKPKNSKFHWARSGRRGRKNHETTAGFSVEGEIFDADLSFGENTCYVELPRLRRGDADVSFGELTVDLRGCASVSEDCSVDADCSFGQLRLLVPSRYKVELKTSTAFGSVTVKGQPDEQSAGIIRLEADASFGEIEVRYV